MTSRPEPSRGRAILWAVAEFFLLIFLIAGTVGIIFYDAGVRGNALSEASVTQQLHAWLALLAGILFGRGAIRLPEKRGYLLLVSVLLIAIFVRENDAFLDQIWHGFWIVPVLILLGAGGLLALRNRQTIIGPFLDHYTGRSFTIFYLGLLILLVFSRLFGTGDLWEAVLNDTEVYRSLTKTVVQEGVELFGYVVMFYGACLSTVTGFGARWPDRPLSS